MTLASDTNAARATARINAHTGSGIEHERNDRVWEMFGPKLWRAGHVAISQEVQRLGPFHIVLLLRAWRGRT